MKNIIQLYKLFPFEESNFGRFIFYCLTSKSSSTPLRFQRCHSICIFHEFWHLLEKIIWKIEMQFFEIKTLLKKTGPFANQKRTANRNTICIRWFCMWPVRKPKKISLFFYRTVLLKCPYFVSFLLVSFNALSILLDAFGQIQAHVNGFFSASYWCVCTCFYSERCIFRYVCIITRTRMTRIKNTKPTAHTKCTSIKKNKC